MSETMKNVEDKGDFSAIWLVLFLLRVLTVTAKLLSMLQ